jgi:polyhydroxyalkanoate synthesis regulator protein
MAFFTEAMRMFTPFAGKSAAKPEGEEDAQSGGDDLDALRRQMVDMQARLEALSKK